MEDVFIALIVFAGIFGVIYVIITARNRERLSLIDKGINPLEYKPKTSNEGLLKWALLAVGVGIGFFIGSILETYTDLEEGPAYFGSVIFFGGLGLLLAYIIGRKLKESE